MPHSQSILFHLQGIVLTLHTQKKKAAIDKVFAQIAWKYSLFIFFSLFFQKRISNNFSLDELLYFFYSQYLVRHKRKFSAGIFEINNFR